MGHCKVAALIVCLLAVHVVSSSAKKLRTSLPDDLLCSACERIVDIIRDGLQATANETSSIEIGSSLNDRSNYRKVSYARSEARILDVLEATCDDIPSFGLGNEYGERFFVRLDNETALEGLNYTRSHDHRKSITTTCHALLEEVDDRLTSLLYKQYDRFEQGELHLEAEVCDTMVSACDYSDTAKAIRAAAREEAKRAHHQWQLAEAERNITKAEDAAASKRRLKGTRAERLVTLEQQARDAADAAAEKQAQFDRAVAALEEAGLKYSDGDAGAQEKRSVDETPEVAEAREAMEKATAEAEEAVELEAQTRDKSEEADSTFKTAQSKLTSAEKAAKRAVATVQRKEIALKNAQAELEAAQKAAEEAEDALETAKTAVETAEKAKADVGEELKKVSETTKELNATAEALKETYEVLAETPEDKLQRLAREAAAAKEQAQADKERQDTQLKEAKDRLAKTEKEIAQADAEVERAKATKEALSALDLADSSGWFF